MNELTHMLHSMAVHDVRAIATRLGVRQQSDERKAAWIAAIVQFWQTSGERDTYLAGLSPVAQAALIHLRQAGRLPWILFQSDYGTIRRPGQQKPGEAPPWIVPQTVSEELYYSGLLQPDDGRRIDQTEQVRAPHFSYQLFVRVDMAQADISAWPLLHDLAQYLIYRHQHQHLRLLHGRWLTPSHLAALNARLLQPEPVPLSRSHKRTVRLCFLAFLAEAAGLVDAAGVTAFGWHWLESGPGQGTGSPPDQLMRLWQGWRDSSPRLRERYDLPDKNLPRPWPHPLLHLLARGVDSYTATTLSERLLGANNAPWRYYVAHFPTSSHLTELLAYLLIENLLPLGVIESAEETTDEPAKSLAQRAWRTTPTGQWLLHPMLPAPNMVPATAQPEAGTAIAQTGATATWLDVEPDNTLAVHGIALSQRPGLFITVPATCTFARQAHLATYGDYTGAIQTGAIQTGAIQTGAIQRPSDAHHRYLLNRYTLARAAADRYPFAPLQNLLDRLALYPTSTQMTTLYRWHEQGQSLRLTQLPLLCTQQTAQMAALWQDSTVRPLLGELLSPTVATVVAPFDEVAQILRQTGHFVPLPGLVPADRGPADESTNADNITEENRLDSTATGVLWLAGQLYRQLGAHLALPAPLPGSTLARLWQALSPHQQAVAQSQLNSLTDALSALLDGYTLTPPMPNPLATDPEQWRLRIGRAVDEREKLRLLYYSAGRNLLTERTIEPYWIEERHGTAYLRAYCHNAGRVLIFRLDRIQGLWADSDGQKNDTDA